MARETGEEKIAVPFDRFYASTIFRLEPKLEKLCMGRTGARVRRVLAWYVSCDRVAI